MKEDSEWSGFTDSKKHLIFHSICQKCNWGGCDNPFYRNRKFDKKKCAKKRKRHKENGQSKEATKFIEETLEKWETVDKFVGDSPAKKSIQSLMPI